MFARSHRWTGVVRCLGGVLLLAVLAGCSVKAPYPDKRLYMLEVRPPVAPADWPGPLELAMRLESVTVASPYDNVSLVYQVDAYRVETDYYHQFAAAPARQLQAQLLEAMQQSGLFAWGVVAREVGAGEGAHALRVTVQRMRVDLTDPRRPEAVVAVSWRLGDLIPIWELQAEHREPLTDRQPQAAVAAYSRAWTTLLQSAVEDLATTWRAMQAADTHEE